MKVAWRGGSTPSLMQALRAGLCGGRRRMRYDIKSESISAAIFDIYQPTHIFNPSAAKHKPWRRACMAPARGIAAGALQRRSLRVSLRQLGCARVLARRISSVSRRRGGLPLRRARPRRRQRQSKLSGCCDRAVGSVLRALAAERRTAHATAGLVGGAGKSYP